jgi:hypothetical protein
MVIVLLVQGVIVRWIRQNHSVDVVTHYRLSFVQLIPRLDRGSPGGGDTSGPH